MKKLVVDTNIIFSALLNTESNIGDLIINSDEVFSFYSAQYLRKEIENHNDKLIEISNLSEQELEESKFQIFNKIHFLSEEQIPFKIWHQSANYVRDVDMDDIAFVAMSEYLDVKLWSGDKQLITGLSLKGFSRCISTQELLEWRREIEKEESNS